MGVAEQMSGLVSDHRNDEFVSRGAVGEDKSVVVPDPVTGVNRLGKTEKIADPGETVAVSHKNCGILFVKRLVYSKTNIPVCKLFVQQLDDRCDPVVSNSGSLHGHRTDFRKFATITGLCSIEFDINHLDNGGRFVFPAGLKIIAGDFFHFCFL